MIQSVLGISAASALPAPLFSQTPPPAVEEHPKLALSPTEAVAEPAPRFFDPESLRTLRHLGEILVPPMQKLPGAVEAEAAEFLDFLIGQSPTDRQTLYRDGVARLNKEARSRFGKPFADLASADADAILAPLREPRTYAGPTDPFARFLRAAKDDFRAATLNSRQWAMASSGAGRRASALNTYWFPIE